MVNYCVCLIYICISFFLCNIWLIVLGTLLLFVSELIYSKFGRNKNNNRIVEIFIISLVEFRKNKRNRKEKERVFDVENVLVLVVIFMFLNVIIISNYLVG